jgi:hypothetical protein
MRLLLMADNNPAYLSGIEAMAMLPIAMVMWPKMMPPIAMVAQQITTPYNAMAA